jgi:hypothetical protein
MRWIPLLGSFDLEGNTLVFRGEETQYQGDTGPTSGPALGNALSDHRFTGGTLEAEIFFEEISERTACELMLYYNPATRAFTTAGLGGSGMFSVRHFYNQWATIASVGEHRNLRPNRVYHVDVNVLGSSISMKVDGVDVIQTQFPVPIPESNVGVWCMSLGDVRISNYKVSSHIPRVFVAMQFSTPFNEIYSEVISKVCSDLSLEAWRADDIYGPGVIIQDITRQLVESQAIIVEITPVNANVYYELGYAHALGKPTILVADRSTKLPFDVSPFRVIFYENSIPGRSRFEEGLRKHLGAIFGR